MSINCDKIRKPWISNLLQPPFTGGFSTQMPDLSGKVDFIESLLQNDKSQHILDVGCCFGWHTSELVGRGYHLTCLDISRSLDKCRKSSKPLAVNGVQVIQQDVTSLNLVELPQFDFCLCTSGFGLLGNDEKDLYLLHIISQSLKPGSKLLLTAPNARFLLDRYPHLLDPLSRRSGVSANTDRRKCQPFPIEAGQRWYTILEINWLLKRVGMQTEHFFAVSESGYHLDRLPDQNFAEIGVLASRL